MRRAWGYLAVAAAGCLWGTWSLFFRPAARIHPVGGAMQAFVVLAVMLIVIGPLAIAERTPAPRTGRAWLLLLGIGIVDGLNLALFFAAMQHTSLAIAVLTHYLSPVLIAVAAPPLLGERMNRSAWLILAVALSGLALLVEPWRASSAGALLGAALGAGSAVFSAANIIASKYAGRWFGSRQIVAGRLPTMLILQLLWIPAGGFDVPLAALWPIALAGLLPGAAASLLFFWGLTQVPASRASIVTLLEPVVAVGIGVLVWHEVPGPIAALGALLVLGAAYFAMRTETEDGRAPVA